MKRALIAPDDNRVQDIVNPGDEYAVHPSWRWVDAPNDVNSRHWRWVAGELRDLKPPPPTLAELKREKLDRITAQRQRALRAATVEYNGITFDAREEDVLRMSVAADKWAKALAANDPRAPTSIDWPAADNTPVSLTLADLEELSNLAWLTQQQIWARNTTAKNAVRLATRPADLRDINF